MKITGAEEAVLLALKNQPLKNSADSITFMHKVKSSWFHYLLKEQQYQISKEYFASLYDLNRTAKLQFEKGNITAAEMSGYLMLYEKIKSLATTHDYERAMALNNLKIIIQNNQVILVPDSEKYLYEIPPSARARLSALDSSMVVENMMLQLNCTFNHIQFFNTSGLVHAHQLFHTLSTNLKVEEIDYLTFAKSIDECFQIRFDYCYALYQYNQMAIELEFYVP
jgi:hypothetical protein